MRYRNLTHAFVGSLRALLAEGERLHVRGQTVIELRNRVTVLERPLERCIITPHRNNNVFATVAETMWVLAGRNDLAYLSDYLPNAAQFSDDGLVWRAGYGPRLRDWHGVDQVEAVLRLLRDELATRRAVMTIFDPSLDYAESRDIPCNNWIHWLVRGGRLHMNVAIRSNDAIWGFSAINAFEWSVLHELMAHWTGVAVGDVTYLASSYHLYEDRHAKRARRIVDDFPGVTCYEVGLSSPRFATPWEAFDEVLERWFELESRMRAAPESVDADVAGFPDPLFGHFLALVQLYRGLSAGWSDAELDARLAALPATDLTAAAYEYVLRQKRAVTDGRGLLSGWYHGSPAGEADRLRTAITRMHAGKDAAYGDSWKRRGEQIGVMANIARKVDRLEHVAHGAPATADESLVDTVVDLYVYLTKYRTFLADLDRSVAAAEFGGPAAGPGRRHSDGVEWFDRLVGGDDLSAVEEPAAEPVAAAAGSVLRLFGELEACFRTAPPAPAMERLERTRRLSRATLRLLASLRTWAPEEYRRFAGSGAEPAGDVLTPAASARPA